MIDLKEFVNRINTALTKKKAALPHLTCFSVAAAMGAKKVTISGMPEGVFKKKLETMLEAADERLENVNLCIDNRHVNLEWYDEFKVRLRGTKEGKHVEKVEAPPKKASHKTVTKKTKPRKVAVDRDDLNL
jgi:hypothetical protein